MSEPSISDAMTFLYLDMLSTLLIEDIKEIEQEYDNKLSFIRAQEFTCLENAKQLIYVDQLVKKFKECIYYTELELEQTDLCLIEAEKIIMRHEATCLNSLQPPENDYFLLKPSHYLTLLKLLLSADCSAAKCNSIREEIELFNKEAINVLAPYNMITKIMDIHVKSLKCLESQVNNLQKLVTEVTSEHDEIAKRLNISSLGMKCTCEMANIFNDVQLDKA